MSAIVVTPELRGWGFTPGTRINRTALRPRLRPMRGEATEADFQAWVKHRIHEPARIEVMQQFNVSRATAYRWMAAARMQEAA